MKQIPILFSTMMVQALLEGRKTMTRRMNNLGNINNNPDDWAHGNKHNGAAPYNMYVDSNGLWVVFWSKITDAAEYVRCPYGKVGDILWARESFYPATIGTFFPTDETLPGGLKWKPSIHMPKDRARIWLEVMSVKVERVQDISDEDAIAEGIYREWDGTKHWYKHYLKDKMGPSPVHSFQTLWEKINGRESWEANPWVWVVEFKVLSTTGKPEHLQ